MQFLKLLEEKLGQKIISHQPIGGGSTGTTLKIQTNQNHYFFKSTENKEMLRAEALGLQEIQESNSIRVPQIILRDEKFLLMEFIPPGIRVSPKKLATDLFKMHQYQKAEPGFSSDNFIGLIPQINSAKNSWPEFFYQQRLLYQMNLAKKNSHLTQKEWDQMQKLQDICQKLCPNLKSYSLLHGDLWSGNILCHEDSTPVLIDPAVYYGHGETDLALSELFGKQDEDFYHEYLRLSGGDGCYPIRKHLYNLYHLINHLNLFGGSYHSQVMETFEFLKSQSL